ncbi:MAG: hypothetical protein WCO08_09015 [Actinomycetes bacterium]
MENYLVNTFRSIAATFAIFILTLSSISYARAADPNAVCAKVPASTVKADVGGTPNAPGVGTGSANFFGFPMAEITCTYSANINITFGTPATSGNFLKAKTTLSHATAITPISGIGDGAFSGIGNNTVCSGTGVQKCVQQKSAKVWFYKKNKFFVIVEVVNGNATGAAKLAKDVASKI